MNKKQNKRPRPRDSRKRKSEYLKVRKGFEDHVDCLCGPDAMKDSFFPCDKKGNLMSENDPGYKYHVLCQYCGRIVYSPTNRVIGKRNVDNFNEEYEIVFG